MAKADSQGIMALPAQGAPDDTGASALPQMGLDDSYDAVQQGLQNASPQASDAVNAELAKLSPVLDQMPDELIDQLLQIIQYMHDNPKEYAKCVQKLIETGLVQEGDFPEDFDPEFLATIGLALTHAKKSRQGSQGAAPMAQAPVPPPGMARGGIAEAAHMVASRGRGKDTMLAHITPKEAQMLRAKGGMGTINPATGLPEYGWLDDRWNDVKGAVNNLGSSVKDAWKGLTNGVKDVFNSPIGRVLGTVALAYFAGPAVLSMTGLSGAAGAAATMAVASGAATALGGGNIGDVLKSAAIGGATAFFAAPGGVVSNFVHGAVSNAAANAAITSGIVGTGIGLLSGQKLQDAVKSGLTAGAISGLSTGVSKGFSAQLEAPKIANVADMATSSAAAPSDVSASNLPAGAQPVPGATVVENGVTYQKYSMPDGTFTYRPEAGASVNAASAAPVRNADGSTTAFLGRATPDANGQPPSVTYGNAPAAPVATDPLGEFIAKNDMQRAAANTPATGGYHAPTVGESFGTMGGGIADIAKGDFSKGWEGLSKGTSDLLFPGSPTSSDVIGSKEYTDLVKGGMSPDKAFETASKNLTPGVIRTYGPATAAGLGIAGLAGAFTPKPPQPTQEEQAMNARLQAERDRVAANPGNYVPKGLEKYGIVYNDRGEITGSNPWNPAPAPGTTEVAGNYMAYKPSPYMTPSGAIGGTQPIYQPFNTASMYTNLMPPQYRAEGGMMTAEPVHAAGGGFFQNIVDTIRAREVAPAIAQIIARQQAQQPQQDAEAARVAEIQNSYRPPVQPMQPQVQQPVEVTNYQQPYNPNQISDLSRRLYPSIYDQGFRDSILSNTAIGSGGIASLATGGYPRRTGPISGPGTETSDSIPAMLSDGEFVMTAKAVRGAGKGSRLAGAKKMYALMHQLERNAARG